MKKPKTLDVPASVVDVIEYRKYKSLSSHPFFNGKKIIQLSDGSELAITTLPHHFKKRIAQLPAKEQAELATMKDKYNGIYASMLVAKRKAFGGKRDIDGEVYRSILDYYKDDILGMMGRFFSPVEIAKELAEQHGIETSPSALKAFRDRHAAEVKAAQEEFTATYSEVRMFQKRSRLEELSYLYVNRKDKYLLSGNREDYKLLLQTIEQLRKESEGEIINVKGSIDINIEADIRLHMRNEMFKDINLKELILGRVAARQGISVSRLVASLNNSYYHAIDAKVGEEVLDAEYTFPSTKNYDFNFIEQKNVEREREEAKEKKSTEPVKVLNNAEAIKQAFLKRIDGNKKRIEGK